MDHSIAADSATIEESTFITTGIRAALDSSLDWRVYEELANGRWILVDVKPTLSAVRWAYDPEMTPDSLDGE